VPEVKKQTVEAAKARDVSAENISMSRPVDHKKACTDHGNGKHSAGATSTIERQTKSLRRKEKEKDLTEERGKMGAHESKMTDASRSSTVIPGELPAKKQDTPDKGPENRSTRARDEERLSKLTEKKAPENPDLFLYEERLSKPDYSLRSASKKSTNVIEWEAQEMPHTKRSEGMHPTRRIETDRFYHRGGGADGAADYNRLLSPPPQKDGRHGPGSLYLRDSPTLRAGACFLFWHHDHYCKSAC
jgi:hypothetical protein